MRAHPDGTRSEDLLRPCLRHAVLMSSLIGRWLKNGLLRWKAAAARTVSIADIISDGAKARGLRVCLDDWVLCARKGAQDKLRATVAQETQRTCSQKEAYRLQQERDEHEKVTRLLFCGLSALLC